MAQTLKEVVIETVENPIDGYRYNAQVFVSVDGGRSYFYSGEGKFFKTLTEAEDYERKILGIE